MREKERKIGRERERKREKERKIGRERERERMIRHGKKREQGGITCKLRSV